MPGKSKKGKGKRYQQTNKANIQRQNTVVAPASAAAAPKPATPIQAKQTVKTAAATANAIANQYTYVPGDLRHIGILTGVIVVILIVLYFILH